MTGIVADSVDLNHNGHNHSDGGEFDRAETRTSSARRLLVSLSLAYSALSAGLTANAAMASLRKSVPMSDTVTSLHGSFFGWGVLALCLSPAFTRRIRRSRLFLGGLIAIGAGAVPFALATNVMMSLGGALLTGFGCAALLLTIPAIVAQSFPNNRASVFARLNIAPVVGGLSLPAVLIAFDRLGWSWRIPVLVAAPAFVAACIAVTVPLIRRGTIDPVPGVHDPKPTGIFTLLRQRQVRTRFILQVASITLEFGFGTWVVVYLRDVGGTSEGAAPMGAIAWGSGMMLVRIITPQLQRAFGSSLEMVTFAAFAGAIGLLVIADRPVVMVPLIAVIAFCIGHVYSFGVDRLYVTAATEGFHDHDSVSILAALASGLAVVLGPLVIGILADMTDLRRAMYAPIAGGLVMALLAARRWRGEAGQLGRLVPHI